jgi:Na+-driven multidrug efflux pump
MFCPANAFSAFSAQNIGAGKYERIPKGFKNGFILSMMIIVPFMAAYVIFPDFALGLFLSGEDAPDMLNEAVDVGSRFLSFIAPFYIPLAIKVLCDGVLRGSGALRPFVFATFADLFVRVLLSYILSPFMGFMGISVGWAVGWVLAGAMAIFFYAKGVWRDTVFSRKLINR